MPRIFVAAPLSDSVRANLARVGEAASLQGARLVPPENMHLTLAFLGDVAERRVADVEEAAYAATGGFQGPLRLASQGLGAFPDERRARVLWAGLMGDVPRLLELREALVRELKLAGFELDAKRFRPHVTLARFRTPTAMPERLPRLQQFGEWDVTELRVIESRLHPSGARYVVRADVELP